MITRDIDVGDLVKLDDGGRSQCPCDGCKRLYESFYVVTAFYAPDDSFSMIRLIDKEVLSSFACNTKFVIKHFMMLMEHNCDV